MNTPRKLTETPRILQTACQPLPFLWRNKTKGILYFKTRVHPHGSHKLHTPKYVDRTALSAVMQVLKIKVIYLHLLAINVQGTNSKVNTNGVLLLFDEDARFEALHHAGLPNIWVTNQDDFKKKVKRVFNLWPSSLHGDKRNREREKKHYRCKTRPNTFGPQCKWTGPFQVVSIRT